MSKSNSVPFSLSSLSPNNYPPNLVDITDEFLNCPIEGDLIKADGFDLCEAVSSVDLLHPKMDRGMLRIEGMSLSEYHNYLLTRIIPFSVIAQYTLPYEQTLRYIYRIEALFYTWMNGASAADTLLTCPVLQSLDAIGNPALHWMLTILLRCSLMIADTVSLMHVARTEEFIPSLHQLANNKQDPFGDNLIQWWMIQQSEVKERDGELFWNECCRLFEWLKFLRIIKMVELDYIAIGDILTSSISKLKKENDIMEPNNLTHQTDEKLPLIVPLLSNLFITGCVRQPIAHLSYKSARRMFTNLNQQLFDLVTFYRKHPNFDELFQFLLKNSLDEGLSFPAIFRSLSFALLLRGQNIFGLYTLQDYLTGSYSNDQIPFESGAANLFLDALQIACHSPSRQRRLIPKLLNAFAKVEPSNSQIIKLASFFSSLFIILGFRLELYSSFEIPEAHWFLIELNVHRTSLRDLAESNFQKSKQFATKRTRIPVYDNYRQMHRWDCIIQQFPSNVLDRLNLAFEEEGAKEEKDLSTFKTDPHHSPQMAMSSPMSLYKSYIKVLLS